MGQTMITVVCAHCEKEFEKTLYEYHRNTRLGRRNFCSVSCWSRYTNNHRIHWDMDHLDSGNLRDELTPFRYFRRCIQGRKHKYALTLEYLKDTWEKQEGICPITGWKMNLPISTAGFKIRRDPRNASLDRIDSDGDYTEGNVRYVVLIANLAKNTWNDGTIYDFAQAVINNKSDHD